MRCWLRAPVPPPGLPVPPPDSGRLGPVSAPASFSASSGPGCSRLQITGLGKRAGALGASGERCRVYDSGWKPGSRRRATSASQKGGRQAGRKAGRPALSRAAPRGLDVVGLVGLGPRSLQRYQHGETMQPIPCVLGPRYQELPPLLPVRPVPAGIFSH